MFDSNALVSIIVPIYGTEYYLPNCIESLCRQTYSNIQIVLVDDQSPDDCPKICDAYAQKDNRIKVVHQQNKGVSGARNTGISVSSGEYVMFVDSDDELYPDAVEKLLNRSLTYNADIVSATARVVDEAGHILFENNDGECTVLHEDMSLLLSLQGDRHTESVWAKLFRKSFIEDICFVEGKNINEDSFFLFQCYIKKPIVVHNNIAVYRYNSRQDSCSRQFYSDKYLAMLYFLERKKEHINEHYPQYFNQMLNMEVRTHLSFLDVCCSAKGNQNKNLQKQSISTIRKLYKYHKPINKHHEQLAWIVIYGLYPLYKILIRFKYYK